jgi:hypothetical protein
VPARRVSMRKLKEVMRLRFELNLGYQQIGRSCANRLANPMRTRGDKRQFASELIIHAQCGGVAGLSEFHRQREWQSRCVKTDQGMITPSGSLTSTYPSGFMVFS